MTQGFMGTGSNSAHDVGSQVGYGLLNKGATGPHPQNGKCLKIKVFKIMYTVNMEKAQAAMAMKKSIHSLTF